MLWLLCSAYVVGYVLALPVIYKAFVNALPVRDAFEEGMALVITALSGSLWPLVLAVVLARPWITRLVDTDSKDRL